MISVIIPTRNAEHELPRCFDSLISAVVRGVVREVIVADGGSDDGTRTLTDATGAHLVQSEGGRSAQLMSGAKAAKSDWLLFLNPETALEAGWDAEVETFISQETLEQPRAAFFSFALDSFGAVARRREMIAAWRCALFGMPYGEQALLIPKRLYQKLGGHRDAPMQDVDLVRRIGRRRLVMLRARAINRLPREPDGSRSPALVIAHALRIPAAVLSRLSG